MDLQRAEGLHEIIDDLKRSNQECPIIVEGERDKYALQRIGIAGKIIVYNTGMSIVEFCDSTAQKYGSVILLTDWDRTGIKLHDEMMRIFNSLAVDVNDRFWIILGRFTGRTVTEVEVLDTFYLSLLGNKGQDPLDRFSPDNYSSSLTSCT